jgi:SAM-dependent methyltransferase
MKDHNIKEVIKDRYGKIARGEQTFCCPSCGPTTTDQCLAVGYTAADLALVPEMAILGVGCGNPTALADLKIGETVLDLGSGAGIDVFLAAKKVGERGRVIGVDMTEDMVARGRQLALWGLGANGKSTYLEIYKAMMGQDYAWQAAGDTFTQMVSARFPTIWRACVDLAWSPCRISRKACALTRH